MTTVRTEIQGSLAIIRINRPDKLNALTPAILDELTQLVEEFGGSDDIRVLALAGCGAKAFAAGCDVTLFETLDENQIVDFMEKGRRAVSALQGCPKPVIAIVTGFALGGGFELVLACDLVIAAEDAQFGFPEVTLGLIPGFGGTQLLPQLIGPHRARDIIYSGRIIDAETARDWGIVNRIAQPEALAEEMKGIRDTLSSHSPIALSAAKRSINEGITGSCEEGLRAEKEEFLRCFSDPQARQRISAFLKSKKTH